MSQTAQMSLIEQAKEELAHRQLIEDGLRAEYANGPAALAEAERDDREALSAAHKDWLENGQRGQPPRGYRHNVERVEARIRELPKEISRAKLERERATERLKSVEIAALQEQLSPVIERRAKQVAERDQLDSEIEETDRELRQYEGEMNRLTQEMYRARGEANKIENDLRYES
jgi:chromosome segregation ATPase